jgi:hypothetical protein
MTSPDLLQATAAARLDYTPIAAPTRKARKYTPVERQCWRTPNTPEQPVLWLVAQALGGEIGIDVTADVERSVPAEYHITAAMDCTSLLSWPMCKRNFTAFMNPPFDAPHIYLDMLRRSMDPEFGVVTEAIALLKIGTLCNQKTGALIKGNASAICHWGAGKVGRMGFIDCDGYQISGADFDTVLVYFGQRRGVFLEVFSDYGMVAKVVG